MSLWNKIRGRWEDPIYVRPVARIGATQSRSFTSASAQSTALSATAQTVRLCATQDCYVEFGANPTATATSMLLPAGAVEYFDVDGSSKIAALRVTTDGALSISEVTL